MDASISWAARLAVRQVPGMLPVPARPPGGLRRGHRQRWRGARTARSCRPPNRRPHRAAPVRRRRAAPRPASTAHWSLRRPRPARTRAGPGPALPAAADHPGLTHDQASASAVSPRNLPRQGALRRCSGASSPIRSASAASWARPVTRMRRARANDQAVAQRRRPGVTGI